MSQNSPKAKECCIILHAYGDKHRGFKVKLEEKNWCPIEELFKIFSPVKDRYHLSIFITSQYGGLAHNSLQSLPIGSSVVTISDEGSLDRDIQLWINSLQGNLKKGTSILNLLNGFLIHGLQIRNNSKLSIVGVRQYDLNKIFDGHLGKPIEPKIVQSLEKRYKTKGKLLDSIADKIHNARDEKPINALQYGKALALTFKSHLASKQ
ncbi:hypothetical protein EAE96_011270 [Botrytis aclada]|nr:hypothetical protein EAE96_011270 [Botrytis aclada]